MTQRLTLIFDRAELCKLGSGRDTDDLLVFEAAAHAELIARGRTHATPLAVLDDACRHRMLELHARAIRFWRDHARIDHAGLNLLNLVAYRHARWIRRLLYPACVLRWFVETHPPDHLHLLDAPGGHALDRPPAARRLTTLHAMAAGVAHQLGIPCESPQACEPIATAKPRPTPPPASDLEPGHILLVGSGAELRRHAPIARALRDIGTPPVVHVYQQPDQPGESELRLADQTVLAEYAYTGPSPDRPNPPTTDARARFDAAAAELDGELASLFANPGLCEHFGFLFGDYARAMARNADRWRIALEHNRPRAVVSSYPTVPLDAAASMGIPALILPHGPMMPGERDYHTLLPSGVVIGAVGPAHERTLHQQGIAPSRVRMTGVVGASAGRWSPRPMPDAPPTVLVPTADTTHPARLGQLPDAAFELEAEVVRELMAGCARRGWRVVLRGHPRYDLDEDHYRRLAPPGAWGSMVLRTTGENEPLAEAVAASHAVVFIGSPSSALPEASVHARPVLMLTQAELFLDRCAWAIDRWPACGSTAKLLETLAELFDDHERYNACARRCHDAAVDFLATGDRSPAHATAEAIAGLVADR